MNIWNIPAVPVKVLQTHCEKPYQIQYFDGSKFGIGSAVGVERYMKAGIRFMSPEMLTITFPLEHIWGSSISPPPLQMYLKLNDELEADYQTLNFNNFLKNEL